MENELIQEEELISLSDLFALLKKNILIIIGAALLCALIGFAVSKFLMTPVYEAKAKMIVNNKTNQVEPRDNELLNSAEKYVSTYSIIIRSRTVLKPAAEALGLVASYESIRNLVTVSPVDNTPVMEITVINSDPQQALDLLNKILAISPDIILDTVEAGSVKTIESPYVSETPVSPSTTRNTLIAFILGLLAAVFFIVARYLLDNTYSNDVDILNDLNIPVLGVIPSLDFYEETGLSQNGKGHKVNE